MVKQGKLFLFFFGFILFSSYGGFLVVQSWHNSGEKEVQVVGITLTQACNTNNPFREEFNKPEETDFSEKPLDFDSAEEQYKYKVQPGSPLTMESWTHECNWMGVGGQVFDGDNPVMDIIVEIGGHLNGEELLGLSLTGLNKEYGLSGYEIQLSDHPFDSSKTIWIRLMDIAGIPLSQKIFLSTYNQCSKNLILVNFIQTETPAKIIHYFPIVYR